MSTTNLIKITKHYLVYKYSINYLIKLWRMFPGLIPQQGITTLKYGAREETTILLKERLLELGYDTNGGWCFWKWYFKRRNKISRRYKDNL